MEEILYRIVTPAVHIIEFFGVVIVIHGAVSAFYHYLKNIFFKDNYHIKTSFVEAMAMGLEFKLAAEILKTVIVKSFNDIFILAAIFALRIIMTIFIHWEMKHCDTAA